LVNKKYCIKHNSFLSKLKYGINSFFKSDTDKFKINEEELTKESLVEAASVGDINRVRRILIRFKDENAISEAIKVADVNEHMEVVRVLKSNRSGSKLYNESPKEPEEFWSKNLEDVKKRMIDDTHFAELTARRDGETLRHWHPPLTETEILEGLKFANSMFKVTGDFEYELVTEKVDTKTKKNMNNCSSCNGDIQSDIVYVPCKCGMEVKISVESIDKQRGVVVVHDKLDVSSNEQDVEWRRCEYSTFIPSVVWCPKCKTNLVRGWKDYLVSGTSDEIEEAQWKYNPIVLQYRQRMKNLIGEYGQLKRVEYLSHFPDFEINFVFERKTIYSGKRRGKHDIHFLSMGYFGEGPRYIHEFLDEAGYKMSLENIAAIKPNAVIQLKNGNVSVKYPL